MKGERTVDLSMYVYPWDLVDEGIPQVLDAMGELGVGTVVVAANYHLGKITHPRNPRRRIVFPEGGVVYFPADEQRYRDSRLKPTESTLVAQRDVLAELCREAEKRGMEVAAWVICLHNTRLGSAYPDCVIENAFGDRYVYAPCPANPDVRRYMRLLVADLTERYPFSGVDLESLDYLAFTHGFHHEMGQVELDAWRLFLLGLCFCPHCTRAAGNVDVPRLRRAVRDALDEYFARPAALPKHHEDEIDSLIGQVPGLAEFSLARKEIVQSLLEEVVAASRAPVHAMYFEETPAGHINGSDLRRAAGVAERVIYCAYDRSLEGFEGRLRAISRTTGVERLTVCVRAGYPDIRGEADLMARVSVGRALGVDRWRLYNYGQLTDESLRWISHAFSPEASAR